MKKIISCFLAVIIAFSAICFVPSNTSIVNAASDNLALGKPATASSTLNGFNLENINDGDYNTNWARGNYGTIGEWVQIDLEDTYILTSIVIHTRLDATDADPNAYKYRTKADVWLSNDPNFETYDKVPGLTEQDKGYGVPVTVKPPKKAYRYIRVAKTDAYIFVLAEVEAFGYPASAMADAAPEYQDVMGSQYENQIALLEKLGAVTPMSETLFGVNNLVTRGQAAELIVNTFVPDNKFSATSGMPFSDVDKSNMYYDSIWAAYNLGYIMGNSASKFNPDAYVTSNEFLTMVLRAMGYAQHLKVVPYPEGEVNILIRELGLLNKVLNPGEQLNMGDAATILYNALMSEYLKIDGINDDGWIYRQSGELLIEDIYSLKVYNGIVKETRKFNLVGDRKSIDKAVRIGTKKLNDSKGKLDSYLGKDVTVIVYDDTVNEIDLVMPSDKNTEVTIKAEDIDKATLDTIVEINGESKKKSYGLSDDIDVVYNGEPYPGFRATDLRPSTGTITLLDNNDDKKYDVVFVNEYKAYRVQGSYSDTKKVSFVDDNNTTHSFDVDYLTMYSSEGYPAMASSLKNGVVAKVYKGKTIGETKIVVFGEPAEKGKITSMNSKTITVNGNTYKFAFGYSALAETPVLNKNVAVFLDENGEILWLSENNEDDGTAWKVGFSVVNEAKTEAFDTVVRFKIFTQDGVFVYPDVAKNIEVDGQRMKLEAFAQKLNNDNTFADLFSFKLLRFKLNGDGLLSAFDTQNETAKEIEMGISFVPDGHIGASLFAASAQSFWNRHTFISMAEATTPVFIIPKMKTGTDTPAVFTASSEFDAMYRIGTVLSIVGDKGHADHNLDVYMKNEEGYPLCFMKTAEYASAAGGTVKTVEDATAPFMLVKEAAEIADGYSITGIDINTGEEVSFVTMEDVSLVESGKIFQDNGGAAENLTSNWFQGKERRINSITLNSASNSEKAKYIKDLSDIRYGDIIRYELAGGKARAVERAFEYNPNSVAPTQSGSVWLSVEGNYPEFFLAYNRFQFSEFKGNVGNVLKFETNGSPENYLKTAFKYVYSINAGGRINIINKESVDGMYAFTESKYRTMIYSAGTRPVGLIIYEY